MKRPAGAAKLLISMTERQLHAQGGIEKGKFRLSQTPLGCGQVFTGVALWGKARKKRRKFRIQGDTVREGRRMGGGSRLGKGLTQVAARGRRLQSTDGRIVPRAEGLPTNSGPSASKFSQGKAEKERGCRQDARGTKIWKGLAKSFLMGSHRQPKRQSPSSRNREEARQGEKAIRAPGRPRPGRALRIASSRVATHRPPPLSSSPRRRSLNMNQVQVRYQKDPPAEATLTKPQPWTTSPG